MDQLALRLVFGGPGLNSSFGRKATRSRTPVATMIRVF